MHDLDICFMVFTEKRFFDRLTLEQLNTEFEPSRLAC